jgi:predicted dehydrogenase
MKRVRIAIIGAGSATEWAILPALSGPDTLAPPDTGAWWARRAEAGDIRYQPPAQPEVVALCDADRPRAERVAAASRVRAVYSDWRTMLREVDADAVVCSVEPELASEVVRAVGNTRRLWIDGPPASSVVEAERLQTAMKGRATRLWCAQPLLQAAAHRAARRLIERDQVGAPSALTLRWGAPLHMPEDNDGARLTSSYAAFGLMLALGTVESSTRTEGGTVVARSGNGTSSVLLHFSGGATATALFAGAESWSAPLPRLEVCGTQGRSLLCEAGRRLWLYHPRESARFWEPPGLTNHVTAANVSGVAEDLKEFLSWCAEDDASNATSARGEKSLQAAVQTLRWMEAAAQAAREENVVTVNARGSIATGCNVAAESSAQRVSIAAESSLVLPL